MMQIALLFLVDFVLVSLEYIFYVVSCHSNLVRTLGGLCSLNVAFPGYPYINNIYIMLIFILGLHITRITSNYLVRVEVQSWISLPSQKYN